MSTISLKISLEGGRVVKTIQFDPSTTVYDACRIIREKILEAGQGDPKEYGLFLASEEDNKKGIWLEASRSLDYYMLRNGDLLEYNKKTRNLRVRMLDGTVKTLLVDDSQVVANLMVVICTKIGITNYDEYGLVREEQKEEPDPCDKPHYGTLTLKRRHQEKERDAKMEQLRKKLRTDDEVNWVEPSKTLREQGIDVCETLLLRRKLFFSDRNVDSRDPVQLMLLYVQARDAILDGTHPVTNDKACEFAGIQCQIQFGDHKEDKHTTGFLDLKEFLPASYVKVKGIEKKIFKEHRKHIGLSELDAKVLYTKSARDLKTYGVAFFLVKEKMKGKNKLVPRLLGVTKDSVLRLDEKTKEILQSWPLTTVRRWCASPNTFTLDFGDYSDQYYSVQTTEAEQILQVIAGYIDIIVRKQRAKDHLGIEGDEGSAMLEDSVSPSKANIIQHDTFKSGKVNTESVAKPAVLRPGAEGAKPYAVSHMTSFQQTTISGQVITGHTPPAATQVQQTKVTSLLSEPQRALLTTITTGREVIKHTETELTRAPLPEVGQDASSVKWKQTTLESNKQAVTSHIAAMNAATAQVVTLTSGPTEEVDHTAVGAAITTITTNLPEMTKGVQMLAALMDDNDNGDRLLDATRQLCSAFSDLLKAAEPETKEPRQSLLNAASRVGEASTSVLHTIGEDNPEDKETQDILLSLAKAVANTTAALVLKAKNVAASCRDDQVLQNNIISAATSCALATSQLVACAKVVAPTIQNPACREQITYAAKQVKISVERLVEWSSAVEGQGQGQEAAGRPGAELSAAAARVTRELQRLVDHCALERRAQPSVTERSVESVMTASERVCGASEAGEMVRQARLLGQATAHLITNIKTEAEKQPSESQRKLLAAAKLLADATARMVEAARQCASSPQDREKQEALRKAAEELRYITVDYAQGEDMVGAQMNRLQESAREVASCATQLIAAATNVSNYNTNKYSQESLMQECKILNESIPRVVAAVRANTDSNAAHTRLELIAASEAMLQPSASVVVASRAVVPTVREPAAARHLADTTHHFANTSTDLRTAVNRARISCKGLELDAAAEIIRSLQSELEEVEQAARSCQLKPLPGQDSSWALNRLTHWSREAKSASAELSRPREYIAVDSGMRLAHALSEHHQGLRAAAALRAEHSDKIIDSGKQIYVASVTLVETVKKYLTTSETVDIATIVTMAKDVSESLERTEQCVPMRDSVDMVVENMNETLHVLDMGEFPQPTHNIGELQSLLREAAGQVESATHEVVSTVGGAGLRPAADRLGRAHADMTERALQLAATNEDRETQSLMVSCIKSVTINSSKLLTTAKTVSQDINRPNAKNQLAAAARAVTDSINRLLDVFTEASPGQKECEAAIRSIQSCQALVTSSTSPLNDLGYFACLDSVLDQSKSLSEGMSGMASAVKKSEMSQFCQSVSTVAGAVQGLVECTAQAAYLVGISEPSSAVGRVGAVDGAMFERASAAIQRAADTLTDTTTTQHQVLSAATCIAKYTSALCNACRVASGKSGEPHAKRHFVQAAKHVANCTAQLVNEIKALDANYNAENRARCAAATVPLREAVTGLCQFASRPEFESIPARLSQQAIANQQPILECGREIISVSCMMLQSAAALALAPQSRPQWQRLAQHSQGLSDTIKRLLTNIREKAPGQHECAAALETMNRQVRQLDQSGLADLRPVRGQHSQGYMEQIENCATEIQERLEPLRTAAKSEAENLGHAVVQLVSYVEPLVAASIGAASTIAETITQSELYEHARTVIESLILLVEAAKSAAGNPRATNYHPAVDSQTSLAREAATELTSFVREVSTARGAIGALVESVNRAKARVTDHRMSLVSSYDEVDSFVDYQTRMVGTAKEIAKLATDMTAKSATDASRLVEVGSELCGRYERLAQDSVGACATTPLPDVANRIRACVVDLGESISECVKAGGACRLSATAENRTLVADTARSVSEQVLSVLGALQAGSRGTQACIDAAASIAAIIGDLDTTILFASAGTLHSDKESDTFSDHREGILKTAKALVEDTKALVAGAAATQDHLADAATNANTTIVQLCEVVKLGAMSLGSSNPEPQVLLLHAARDVAAALRDLAAATTAASGKHLKHPDMQRLKHAAKVMVTNVTSLLKTVKAVEDEHTRGTRAIESTIEAIAQEIEVLLSPIPPNSTATPEELVRVTRQMTSATAKVVSAGNSTKQDQLTAAANLGRKTVVDLLGACKGAAFSAESAELQSRTIEAGRAAAEAYRSLLQAVLQSCNGDANAKHQFPELSRRVAHTVADIIAIAELLKGSDWVDPDDPTVIAESELLGAAASIDAAAKKLDSLRPRKPVTVKETDETLNFDEMILEAAKSIIAATSALVRAASAAQRELIDQGIVSPRPHSSSPDGQWSEGLVSAARLVAAAAHALVEAANALVQGAATEERLVSSARQVASSTAQLLVACKVKADPSSESTRRLQAAGAEVIRSTDNLVRAARDAMTCEDERSLVLNRRMVGGIAQEIDARSEVLRIEKELEEARGRLTAIRQAKYKLRDTSGEDTDYAGYTSDTSGQIRLKTPTSSFVNTTYSPNSTYSPNAKTQTDLSQHVSQLNQSIHGLPQTPTSPGFQSGGGYSQNQYNQSLNQSINQKGYNQSPGYSQSPGYQGQSFNQSPSYNQGQSFNQSQQSYNQSQSYTNQPEPQNNGYNQSHYQKEEKYSSQGPTFSSFRPQDEPKQNYEGFTTRGSTNDRTMKTKTTITEQVIVKALHLPEVKTAYLVNEDNPTEITANQVTLRRGELPQRLSQGSERSQGPQGCVETIYYKPEKAPPPPPPRRVSLLNYETRLYDTPRQSERTEEQRQMESQYMKQERYYEAPKTPLSPKFNARELKSDDRSKFFEKPFDGVGQTFSEHQKSTEAIPGGTKQTEYSVKSESYSSYPKVEITKMQTHEAPFATSTPSKFEHNYSSQFDKSNTADLVKVATPEFDRIASPYGKEIQSYSGPNFLEETMTEVKDIPNGTQKITTTKIYSSSPVNITSTSTKYEPVKLEGIDELSKIDTDSKYSTLDSRFNTIDSKMSSDTSRSFMRPSEFQSATEFQSTTKTVKPELSKELDNLDRKFSKQTITSERIEKRSVMTSSHKSETSSTVTKKFGNL